MSGVSTLESHPSNKVPISGLMGHSPKRKRFYSISRRRFRAANHLDSCVSRFKINPCQATADDLCKAMGTFHSAVEWEKTVTTQAGIKE